jgi:hypothetical protein
MTFEEWRKETEQILMAWHNDDPACVDKDHWRQSSIAITDHGKRRVTPLNSSTSAPPRPLQSADGGPLFPADDLGCETMSPHVSHFCALLLRRRQAFFEAATVPPMRSYDC